MSNVGAGTPWCQIVIPADGSTIKKGSVNVVPQWEAPGPFISKLDLLADGVIVETLSYSPNAPRKSSFAWHAGVGSHTLTCVITDTAGGAFTSGPVRVTVV